MGRCDERQFWVAYVALVAVLTLASLAQPIFYYLRFFVLLPLSLPLLVVDWWGGVLLFGPNPIGTVASMYFVGVAIAAASLQAFTALRLARARSGN